MNIALFQVNTKFIQIKLAFIVNCLAKRLFLEYKMQVFIVAVVIFVVDELMVKMKVNP